MLQEIAPGSQINQLIRDVELKEYLDTVPSHVVLVLLVLILRFDSSSLGKINISQGIASGLQTKQLGTGVKLKEYLSHAELHVGHVEENRKINYYILVFNKIKYMYSSK